MVLLRPGRHVHAEPKGHFRALPLTAPLPLVYKPHVEEARMIAPKSTTSGRYAGAALVGASVAVLVAAAMGCGRRTGPSLTFVETMWDRPVKPPPTVEGTMVWGEGQVTDVSLDGATLHIKMTRGIIPAGSQIGIFIATPENPSRHYLWEETREMRAAEARVVTASATTCKAEVINLTTNAPIAIGDKVIIRVP